MNKLLKEILEIQERRNFLKKAMGSGKYIGLGYVAHVLDSPNVKFTKIRNGMQKGFSCGAGRRKEESSGETKHLRCNCHINNNYWIRCERDGWVLCLSPRGAVVAQRLRTRLILPVKGDELPGVRDQREN